MMFLIVETNNEANKCPSSRFAKISCSFLKTIVLIRKLSLTLVFPLLLFCFPKNNVHHSKESTIMANTQENTNGAEKVEEPAVNGQVSEAVPFPDEEEAEEEVTMAQVLQEETEREEDAVAVLGGSDETKCSYDAGYVKRQALYACKTCADVTGVTQAGVCLACSIKCHDGHDCYELYTKRNFRCDCGIPKKFGDNKPCQLIPGKEENTENSYNQNFEGKYCTCHRPYPDPEDETDDQMIQCVSCEDWFHGRHLVNPVPDDFAEMICTTCMEKNSFLWFYIKTQVEKRTSSEVDIEGDDDAQPPAKRVRVTEDTEKIYNGSIPETALDSVVERKEVSEAVTGSENNCFLKELQGKKDVKSMKGATFWPNDWRSILCLCQDCQDMYKKHDISFITDLKDTVHFYEEEGRRRLRAVSPCSSTSSMERGMEAFGHMPRTQQIEMLHGYNAMESALKEFLKSFAEQDKVVTKKDVEDFFAEFKRKQNAKNDNPLSYSCGR